MFVMFHNVCYATSNKQYTGKSETTFNLRLHNHRKDVNKKTRSRLINTFDYLVITSINTQNLH